MLHQKATSGIMLAIHMNPDYETTKRFLLWLYPPGPWTLTAISVSKKEIHSDRFDTIDATISWIQDHNRFNLYYSINEPMPQASHKKKFSKSDIAAVHFLHVDVDPRANEDIKAEQDRILTQLLAYKIQPSAIIFSGGGYNALWRLEQPVSLKAETPEEHIRNAIEVERRNWQFELDFNTPDHCRDVSRILRLPGTINWPNAEKVAKGRTPSLATIHSIYDVRYPLTQFMATPSAPVNVASTASARTTLDVRRIESIDELEVPEKLKKVIVQGHDPDDPQTVKSRSEWLFYACCEMVRNNVPDEIIHGVITDSRFGISESVLDKGSGITRYALRQISRARDLGIHPRLAEMNEQFAVIENYHGKCVVLLLEESRVQYPKEFFAARASSHIIGKDAKGKEAVLSDGRWWFNQARRRQYRKVVFNPAGSVDGEYNIYKGFAIQPREGNYHEPYLDLVKNVICSGVEEHYDYLIKWMARVVQYPATQSETAVVMTGVRGTGKTSFCGYFRDLFGPHGESVDNMDHLLGRFNSHLADKLVVVAEEAYHVYDRRSESSLKELITGKRRAIERKGYDVTWGENFVHLMMTSNNHKVVPAGDYERRFFVLEVSQCRMSDKQYFGAIQESMQKDAKEGFLGLGYANLLHFLLNIDLTGFEVRTVPKTKALVEQQSYSLTKELEWLLDKLQMGIWFATNTGASTKWEGPIVKTLLYDDYQQYMTLNKHPYIFSRHVWHEWMKKEMPFAQTVTLSEKHGTTYDRPVAFIFPALEYCRTMFLKNRSWPSAHFKWEEPLFVSGVHDKPDGPFG
jgi:hypothetical protein